MINILNFFMTIPLQIIPITAAGIKINHSNERISIMDPVTAVQSKSGTYASPHLHGEMGRFLAEGMVHEFQQKGGVFEGGSPLI